MSEEIHSNGLGLKGVSVIFAITAAILISVFNGAEWRAENELLPRYCDNPEAHLNIVHQILTKKTPAGDQTRRPYIIAAKLLYIVPREDEESVDNYILRLRFEVYRSCR
ncbi:MAG: hypothetical protein COB59_00555 [Rhodospirillaceae bacterium]|nr:MAG: hypothetical protein COB59_00555 [Rhodospirillaceae bacterium]